MNKVSKGCAIYAKRDKLIFFSIIETPYGGVHTPPAEVLASSASGLEIGKTLVKIFERTPNQVVNLDLEEGLDRFRTYIKESGHKSISELEKKSISLTVDYDGEKIKLIPFRKAEGGGFLADNSGTIILTPDFLFENVGQAILNMAYH